VEDVVIPLRASSGPQMPVLRDPDRDPHCLWSWEGRKYKIPKHYNRFFRGIPRKGMVASMKIPLRARETAADQRRPR
jgi:hypothetical protein